MLEIMLHISYPYMIEVFVAFFVRHIPRKGVGANI